MQKSYIDTVYELAEQDKNVLMMTADNGTDYDKWFKQDFPNQYLDMGISECNMVSAAAGLASVGKIPFVQTGGSFFAYRALEFIRNDVCLQRQNVKLIGTGSGLSISNLGPTHHSTEDIGILHTLPNLTILSPCSATETADCVRAAYQIKGPVYIRLGMSDQGRFDDANETFRVDRCVKVRDGNDAVIFSTGSILSEALHAAEELGSEGLSIKVVNVHTLKPISEKDILNYIGNFHIVVTVEEHNIFGGLGSIVSDIITANGRNIKLVKAGLNDCFAKGYGSLADIRKNNGIDKESIKRLIRNNSR